MKWFIMKCFMRYGWLVIGLCVGLLVIGCASYYKVTDPQSGKEYFTQAVEDGKKTWRS